MLSNVVLCSVLTVTAPPADTQRDTAFSQAHDSAEIAGFSLSKVHRWLHEHALAKIDPATGLYRADGKWNYRDTAADCYPFFAWAAFVVDRDVLNGTVRRALHQETKLCNTHGRIPIPWDFATSAPVKDFSWDDVVFEASEYVKDGLIAIVEATGPDEWFERMRAIQDDVWQYARVDTPFGKIPSTNIEVNGEQLQALARLYTMTGDEKYLDWAERLADFYLSDENFVPQRLRDHGCEIIGGLGLLLAVESTHRPEKAAEYAPQLRRVFDAILARGCNADGIMYNSLDAANDAPLSDGWGYNYVGLLCYDMATRTDTYRRAIERTLAQLSKPLYQAYRWEGDSIDGWADSIEGGLYLLNRLPVSAGLDWANHGTAAHLVFANDSKHMWGTSKLQANGVRTTLIHALMHTQGLIARPWQPGLELGAAPLESGVAIVLRSRDDYNGALEFDIPRHRIYQGFASDWPRMNTLPEWFVVEPDGTYVVRNENTGVQRHFTGRQLHNGLAVQAQAHATVRFTVFPAKESPAKK